MNRRDFLTMSLSIPLAAILLPKNSYATGLIAGATEFTQITNMVQLIMQYATQIEQYATQLNTLQQNIQQVRMQAQNLVNLPAGIWNKFTDNIMSLKNIIQQGQGITFAASNLDSQFAAMYPGYDGHFTAAGQSLASRNATFTDRYKQINTSTRDNINGALKSLNLQMNDLNSDAATMSMLQSQSQSADGQLKVIQAANEISLHQTEQMKKLQWTLMTQANTQAAYMAAQNEKETAQRALSERRQQYTIPNTNRAGNTRRYENWR